MSSRMPLSRLALLHATDVLPGADKHCTETCSIYLPSKMRRRPIVLSVTRSLVRCSFGITLEALATFRNDTGMRSFVSILVRDGRQAVCDLVKAVDRAFAFLGLQTFHQASPCARTRH